MHGKRFLAVLLLTLMVGGVLPAFGQDAAPLVVFVLNPDIETASPFDSGPDGVSALDNIFKSLGARTQVINLIDPIPNDAEIVVMVGSRKRISVTALARLWVHMARGKHLLLALDPPGYGDVENEDFKSGLLGFINNAYGLITYDAFMAEPWFTKESIVVLPGAYLQTHGDVALSPIIAPITRYDLPVMVWGARPIKVEPIGVDSYALPLLQTTTAYGETNLNALQFTAVDAPPLEMNIAQDIIGRVNIAGVAENTRSGSRVALLGDSEMLRNGYGMATVPGTTEPRHLGNRLLVERLAAWLLDIPQSEWADIPSGFTLIALDGFIDDWDIGTAVATDGLDSAPGELNLRAVRALRNNAYLYLLAQTVANPSDTIQIDITIRQANSDTPLLVSATTNQVTVTNADGTVEVVGDGRLVTGEAVEIRLPVRLIGENGRIEQICSIIPGEEADCLSQRVQIVASALPDPADARFTDGPLVSVNSIRSVALREAPTTDSTNLTLLGAGDILRVVGRTEDTEWVQVQTGTYSGWVFTSLVIANTDLNLLPVTDGSIGEGS
jgi:hypothetical protein